MTNRHWSLIHCLFKFNNSFVWPGIMNFICSLWLPTHSGKTLVLGSYIMTNEQLILPLKTKLWVISNFFSGTSLKTLRLAKLTVVLDLVNWWQPSICGSEILIYRCEKISITFCSNCSSFTSTGTPVFLSYLGYSSQCTSFVYLKLFPNQIT